MRNYSAIRASSATLILGLSLAAHPVAIAQRVSLGTPDSSDECRREQDLSNLPADSALLRIAAVVGPATPAMNRAWPGFWSASQELLLHRGGVVALVSGAPRLDSIQLLERRDLAGSQSTPAYLFYGSLEDFWPVLGYSAAPKFSNLKAPLALPTIARDLRWNLQVLYHEHFHRFQIGNFRDWRLPRGSDAPHSVRMREPEFARLVAIEMRMLSTALDASDPDSLRSLLRGYLSVRHTRTSNDSVAQWSERQMERMEGVAEYVGREAARLALDCGTTQARKLLVQEDSARALSGYSQGRPDTRIYFTGAVLSFLLDELGVDWKKKVQQGAYLDPLLAAAINFSISDVPQQVQLWTQRLGPAEPQ